MFKIVVPILGVIVILIHNKVQSREVVFEIRCVHISEVFHCVVFIEYGLGTILLQLEIL